MKSRSAAWVGKAQAGYTITEVMIVLAVSGALFLSAALMLSGRQATTELTQAVRDYESQLQSVANDVIAGFYPNGFTCEAADGASPTITTSVVDTNKSGANSKCISLGKVMALHEDNADIFTVVGRRYKTGGLGIDVQDLTDAKPIAVAHAATANPSDADVTINYVNRYQLRVTKAISLEDNSLIYAIAILNELGASVTSDAPVTGSRSVKLYSLRSAARADSPAVSADRINAGPFTEEKKGVRICFEGGNGRLAEITIGSSNDRSSTYVKIDTGVGADCA